MIEDSDPDDDPFIVLKIQPSAEIDYTADQNFIAKTKNGKIAKVPKIAIVMRLIEMIIGQFIFSLIFCSNFSSEPCSTTIQKTTIYCHVKT